MYNDLEKQIEAIIYNWLENTFHNNEAIPKLIVNGIAREIVNYRWKIYSSVKNELDLEDIYRVAEVKEIKLTDEEANIVLNRYQDGEYQDIDTINYLIDKIIKGREE